MRNYIKLGLAAGVGHLLGSDFDWIGTAVLTFIAVVGLFVVEKAVQGLTNYKEFEF
jgi:hypothetical protein